MVRDKARYHYIGATSTHRKESAWFNCQSNAYCILSHSHQAIPLNYLSYCRKKQCTASIKNTVDIYSSTFTTKTYLIHFYKVTFYIYNKFIRMAKEDYHLFTKSLSLFFFLLLFILHIEP